MGWWPDNDAEPAFGSVNGEHDVFFKVSDSGHTLISDAEHGSSQFNSTGIYGTSDYAAGRHDHYGPGDGPNDNSTSRGWYTGPGA